MKLKSASGFAGVCAGTGLTWKWLAPTLLIVLLAAVSFGVGNPRPAYAHDLCPNTGSPLGPFNMNTYEDHRQTYARTFELAGRNQLLPELPGFALPGMETGPRSAGSSQLRPGYVPPVLLKAIAWIEASWAQADYSVPYGAAGPTLISHDCGYGLMQVTTGMQNVTGVPTVNQAMIGGHYAFNIARGAQIVIDKWNTAPEYRPIVGSRDPAILENWYYAVWGYNGFSYKNHPLNPIYPTNRLPYSCGPTNDGFGHNRGQYPYQELVFGCMAHPPIVAGAPLWAPQSVNVPRPGSPMFTGPLRNANWDACAYNLQCAPMDMATPTPNNRDGSALTVTRSQVIGTPSLGLSASTISMVAVPPSQPGVASLTIRNTGTGVLSYRIVSSASWLRVSRYQDVALGANLGGRTSPLQITANTTGMGPGRYTGQLTINSPLTAGAPAVVTVTLNNYPDGTLLKGTAAGVYVMSGGLRRGIPNGFTFGANGFDWAKVIPITDTALRSLAPGNALPDAKADGNLYRASGGPVWVLDHGVKRHVNGEAVLAACGYGWDAVRAIPDSLLDQLATGIEVKSPSCPKLNPVDGSLIKGSGPAVYLMRSGLKRSLPNMTTFNGMGLKWGNVDVLADSLVNGIPAGNQMLNVLTTGILVKGSSATVFVMENGRKRGIPSPTAMADCNYSWESIILLPDINLNGVPTGTSVASGACPVFSPPNGAMLRGSGGTVYVSQQGLKRPFPNPATLEGRGYFWGNVDVVHDNYVAKVPPGKQVLDLLTTGHLIKGPGAAVFVMDGGVRRGVPSPAMMASCGYRWDAVYTLSAARLNSVPSGENVTADGCPQFTPADGSLLQGNEPGVYVSEDGRKRGIASPDVLEGCNYLWGNVDRVKSGVIASLPDGQPLTAPPCP